MGKLFLDLSSWDFIIVGGGTAGSILASRLSEVVKWKILLLEAGDEPLEISKIPGAILMNYLSQMNWGYLTKPQLKSCWGMKNRQCDYTTGKTLGGSSVLGATVRVRGNERDFDTWEEMGNVGWSFKDVLPYFIKSERTLFNGDRGYHGKFGPMINKIIKKTRFEETVLNGMQELGYDVIDYNGKRHIGVSPTQVDIDAEAIKVTTYDSYLKPVKDLRRNLKIIRNSLVTKIGFFDRVAKNVTFYNMGLCFQASATIEIILSAGTIGSSQLLMLSGVGPRNELKKHNISLITDLPVGMNFTDHTAVSGIYLHTNVTVKPTEMNKLFDDYYNGKGDLAHGPGLQVALQQIRANDSYPDIEHVFFEANDFTNKNITMHGWNYNELMDDYIDNVKSNDLGCVIFLLKPKSRGTITLKSSDPLDFPLIDPNMYSDPDDETFLLEGFTNFLTILNTDSFKKINVTLSPLNLCMNYTGDEYWSCFIRYKSLLLYHACSSCRMGQNPDESVVASNLKVHNLENLRVVDASVMPAINSGHSQPVVIMIAEKAADMIKATYIKTNRKPTFV